MITVALRDVPVTFEFVGQTQSSQQVEIRARVSGFLDKRVYTEGSTVHAGDLLFQMDRKPFEAALDAAQAAFNQQRARLDTAQADLNRVKPLAAANALSQKDLDDAVGQQQAAAAAVEQARANVTSAQLNLGYTMITSPVTGLSSFAKKQEGTYIDPGSSLLTYVAKLDPIWVNFSLSENELLEFRSLRQTGALKLPSIEDLDVEIVLADGSVYPEHGRISFADASRSTRTPAPTSCVRKSRTAMARCGPGQFVRARLRGAERTQAIAIPQQAVLQGDPRRIRPGPSDPATRRSSASSRPGTGAAMNGIISSGLRAGDRVVVENTIRVSPDAPLKAVPASMPAAGSRPARRLRRRRLQQAQRRAPAAKWRGPRLATTASTASAAAPVSSSRNAATAADAGSADAGAKPSAKPSDRGGCRVACGRAVRFRQRGDHDGGRSETRAGRRADGTTSAKVAPRYRATSTQPARKQRTCVSPKRGRNRCARRSSLPAFQASASRCASPRTSSPVKRPDARRVEIAIGNDHPAAPGDRK